MDDTAKRELEFWMACYASALANKDSRRAKSQADHAVIDLRDRLEVISVNRQQAAA